MTEAKKVNPLIQKDRSTMPGTVYRMPSRGVFYEETDILDESVIDGEVTVYPMRLREELAMKAVDAVFQGTAVTDTIRYCVPQINQPEKLVAEDIDYLLTVIKKLTHGDFITYKDTCFDEERLKKLEKADLEKSESSASEEMAKSELDDSARAEAYEIRDVDQLDILQEKMREAEQELQDRENVEDDEKIEEIGNGICEFQIPVEHFLQTCKPVNPDTIKETSVFEFDDFLIRSRPLTFEDLREISLLTVKDQAEMTNKEFIEYATKYSNANIAKRLIMVDDISDQETIEEWVGTLHIKRRTALYEKMLESQGWGIDFKYEVHCPRCGKSKMTDQSYLNPLYFFLT